MLNRLYNKAFRVSGVSFDPARNYYTKLMNFVGKSEYGKALSESLHHYIDNNFYEEHDLDFELIVDESFGEKLRADRNKRRADVSYMFLFDYEDSDIGTSVCEAVRSILQFKAFRDGDRLSLVITLPNEPNRAKAYIAALEKAQLPDIVTVYFFVKVKYEQKRLIDSICSVLLLNSEKDQCRAFEKNKFDTDREINSIISTFPEEGQKSIFSRPKIFWSAVMSSYNDIKMDFIRYYMYNLCCNAEEISTLDFAKICGDFFSRQVATTDVERWVRRLEHAVKMIPRMKSVKIKDDISLDRYFDLMYGSDDSRGCDVVELTLKVNLSKMPTYESAMIEMAANYLFEQMEQYHSDDLYNHITSALDIYREGLDGLIQNSRKRARDAANCDGNVEDELTSYIRLYIKYNDDLKQKAFWTDVANYLKTNREQFEERCAASAQMSFEFEQLKKELRDDEQNFAIKEFPRFPAKKLLNADRENDIGEIIGNEFEKIKAFGSHTSDPKYYENRIYDFFDISRHFYRDYEYSFSIGGTYTVNITQRIGTYLMF